MSATFLIHDLWKGFDITNEESSWRLMIHYGIQQKYINLVKTMLCEVLSLSSSSSFTSICINLNTEGNLYGFIQNWNYLYGFTQSWSNLNDLLKTQETCGFTQSWRNLYGFTVCYNVKVDSLASKAPIIGTWTKGWTYILWAIILSLWRVKWLEETTWSRPVGDWLWNE